MQKICVLSYMKTTQPTISFQSIRRLQAGILILNGYDAEEVAEITQASKVSYYRWKKILNENKNDLTALSRKPSSGRKPKLNAEQMVQLRQFLSEKATSYGYNTDRWTSTIVADLIEKNFEVSLKPRAVRYILNKIGLSYQKPVVKDYRQKPEEVEIWIKRDWSRIKKSKKTRDSHCFS